MTIAPIKVMFEITNYNPSLQRRTVTLFTKVKMIQINIV